MTAFVGLVVYVVAVYTACVYADWLAHRRRVAAWQGRARRIQHMKGRTG